MVIDVTTIPVQPGLSTGSTTTVVLESVLQLSGLASSYNSYIRAAMIQDLADALGVQTTQITLTFVDGTPLGDHCFCTVQITVESSARAAALRPFLQTHFSTPSAASNVLNGTSVQSIPVQPTILSSGSSEVLVESVVQLAGNLSTYDAATRASLVAAIALAMNVSESSIALTFA